MIAVDTSALVAIVLGETEREAFTARLREARLALVSTVSVVEARMVVFGRRGPRGVVLLDDLLRLPMFKLASPEADVMAAAFAAFIAYGKGSGHPAGLNFGDIFSYALAKILNAPLLFKGNDFAHTDIEPALPRDKGGTRP